MASQQFRPEHRPDADQRFAFKIGDRVEHFLGREGYGVVTGVALKSDGEPIYRVQPDTAPGVIYPIYDLDDVEKWLSSSHVIAAPTDGED